MNILLVMYELVLLGYTAWRTYDFLKLNIPTDFGEELALLGLFALDIGLILWHYYLRKHAKSQKQEDVAKVMVVADFAGSFGAGVADMILRQTLTTYTVPPLLATVLIWGIPAIVALNVGGVLYVQYADPEEKETRLKRIAMYMATEKALEEVIENIDGLALELSKDIAGDIRKRVRASVQGRYYGSVKIKEPEQLPAPPATIVAKKPRLMERLLGRAGLAAGLNGAGLAAGLNGAGLAAGGAAIGMQPVSDNGASPESENPTQPGQ